MNTKFSPRRPAALASLFALALLLASLPGCNGWYRLLPGTPSGAATAEDKESASISISWAAVANGGVYYIYRSEAEAGTYEFIAQTEGLEYIDTDIEWDRRYYYKLSAGDFWGNEGSLSAAFSGITYQYSWDAVPTELAAAGSDPQVFSSGQVLYFSWLDADRNIKIKAWEPGKEDAATQWTELLPSPGRVKAGGRYHMLRANQTWYAAFQDYIDPASLLVLTFNADKKAWESLGDIYADCVTAWIDNYKYGVADVQADFTSLTDLKIRRIGTTVYVAILEASHRLFVLRYNSDLVKWFHEGEAPFVPNTLNTATPSQAVFAFDALENQPTVAYSFGGVMKMRAWDGNTWTDLAPLTPAGAAADSDNIVFLPSGLYLCYESSLGAITSVMRVGEDWTDLGASGLIGAGEAGAMGGIVDGRNYLHLFIPTAAGFSTVRFKPKSATDETNTAGWVEAPDPTGIQGRPGKFAMASLSQEIHVVYEENSSLKIVCYR